MHNVRGKVHIDIMRSLYTCNKLACNIDSLCMLVFYCCLDLSKFNARLNSCNNVICDDRVCRKCILVCAYEVLIDLDNLKLVTCLYQKDKLLFRHDLSVFSVPLCAFLCLVIIWEFHACKVVRCRIADIYLVWPVVHTFLIGTQMTF